MKELFYYGGTLLAAGLLIYLSELWYDGDKVLGFAAIGLFALFLQVWKRWGNNSLGLVIVTMFYLFTLDSIFFVQDILIFTGSLVIGALLMPHFQQQRDAVTAAIGFVWLNMLITLEFVPSEIMIWLIAFVTGATALIGFRCNYMLVKVCFALLFTISALFLVFIQVFDGAIILSILAVLAIAFFVIGMVRLNSKAAAGSM